MSACAHIRRATSASYPAHARATTATDAAWLAARGRFRGAGCWRAAAHAAPARADSRNRQYCRCTAGRAPPMRASVAPRSGRRAGPGVGAFNAACGAACIDQHRRDQHDARMVPAAQRVGLVLDVEHRLALPRHLAAGHRTQRQSGIAERRHGRRAGRGQRRICRQPRSHLRHQLQGLRAETQAGGIDHRIVAAAAQRAPAPRHAAGLRQHGGVMAFHETERGAREQGALQRPGHAEAGRHQCRQWRRGRLGRWRRPVRGICGQRIHDGQRCHQCVQRSLFVHCNTCRQIINAAYIRHPEIRLVLAAITA